MRKGIPKSFSKGMTWVQICWFAALVMLIGCGFLALHTPGNELTDIAVYLGVSMMIIGIINLTVYHQKKKILNGSHWLLADGMCMVLLSLFPIFNQMIQPALLPFFFGVWELFSGILKEIESSEFKEENIAEWKWFRAIGSIELVSGVAALLKPVDDFVGMNVVVAIIFFIQSCGFLFKIVIYPQMIKKTE